MSELTDDKRMKDMVRTSALAWKRWFLAGERTCARTPLHNSPTYIHTHARVYPYSFVQHAPRVTLIHPQYRAWEVKSIHVKGFDNEARGIKLCIATATIRAQNARGQAAAQGYIHSVRCLRKLQYQTSCLQWL